MDFFWKGMVFGLGLSILVGPLLFTLITATLERGRGAGLQVALGYWISDALFIILTYLAMASILQVLEWPGFETIMRVGGGLVLLTVGGGMFFRRSGQLVDRSGKKVADWWKGFLVNTINPFTVVFWTGIAGGVLADSGGHGASAWGFYGGVMLALIAADLTKISLAGWLRAHLTPEWVRRVSRLAGVVLAGMGVYLWVDFLK